MSENILESLYHHLSINSTTTDEKAAVEDIFESVLRLPLKSLFLNVHIKVIVQI